MKATLDIPDDVARAVQRRADREGLALVEQIVQLVKLGLVASAVPSAVFEQFLRVAGQVAAGPAAPGAAKGGGETRPLPVSVSAATGLAVIHGPPDAPAHSMTVDEILALTQDALSEDDRERAGLSVRY